MPATEEFVLDGSVTMAWYFADEANDYATSVANCLPAMTAHVPSLWPLEIANVLVTGERRKRSTPAQAATWTAFLATLPILIDHESDAKAFRDILDLARMHNLTAYDAAYLELAIRKSLPLASLDDKLKQAAPKVGVPIFQPPQINLSQSP